MMTTMAADERSGHTTWVVAMEEATMREAAAARKSMVVMVDATWVVVVAITEDTMEGDTEEEAMVEEDTMEAAATWVAANTMAGDTKEKDTMEAMEEDNTMEATWVDLGFVFYSF
jgi:hypothetical protein